MRAIYHQFTIGNIILAATLAISACSTEGPRRSVEMAANRHIGKLPEEAFVGFKNVNCHTINGERGCLVIDRRGCEIWYEQGDSTGRITNWRYAGAPEKCWTFSHSG